jgi:hypothetical protein
LKVGIEHYRKEPDNSFTQLETTFHDLIAYRGAAEQGRAARQGRQHHRRRTGARLLLRANGQRYEGEEFIATRIGHDLARTRYEVDRTARTAAGTRLSRLRRTSAGRAVRARPPSVSM